MSWIPRIRGLGIWGKGLAQMKWLQKLRNVDLWDLRNGNEVRFEDCSLQGNEGQRTLLLEQNCMNSISRLKPAMHCVNGINGIREATITHSKGQDEKGAPKLSSIPQS